MQEDLLIGGHGIGKLNISEQPEEKCPYQITLNFIIVLQS
jgi:hypothetical protein